MHGQPGASYAIGTTCSVAMNPCHHNHGSCSWYLETYRFYTIDGKLGLKPFMPPFHGNPMSS
jgi:hypothetical protein